MINYELLNQVLVLARAIEIFSLIAAFAFTAHVFGKLVQEIANVISSRKKNVDNIVKK